MREGVDNSFHRLSQIIKIGVLKIRQAVYSTLVHPLRGKMELACLRILSQGRILTQNCLFTQFPTARPQHRFQKLANSPPTS